MNDLNDLIETTLAAFSVDGVEIPVSFTHYIGHGEPYITYMLSDSDSSYSGDNELLGYVVYYDFDVYSKSNYLGILEALREALEAVDFIWQPSKSGPDMYEVETGYYHRTMCFAFMKGEE